MRRTSKPSQPLLFGWLRVGPADLVAPDEPDTSTGALWRTLRGDRLSAAAFAVLGLVVVFDVLAAVHEGFAALALAADLTRPLLAILVVKVGLSRILRRQERRFWNEIALAFGFWFAGMVVLASMEPGPSVHLISASLYAASFLALVVAVERPMRKRRALHAPDHSVTLTWSGGTVFVFGILFYFVLVPRIFGHASDSRLLGFYMFLVFDAYLTAKLVYFSRIAGSPRWSMLYSLLALAMLAVSFADGLDSLTAAGVVTPSWTLAADFLWNVPYLFLVLAARLRHHPFPTEEPLFDSVRRKETPTWPRERLVVYALLFPLIHFIFQFLELLGSDSQWVREGFVMVWLLLFGALAIVQQRVQEKRTRTLWLERLRSEEALSHDQATRRLNKERHQAEQALRKSEEKFSKAFRSTPDAMLISTLVEGRMLEVNESFQRLFGYSRGEMLGKTGIELKLWVEPHDRAMMTRLLSQRGRVRNLELELTTKSGEKRQTMLSGEIIDLEGEACLLIALRDVTEKKQLEEKLRRARRLESIGSLTSAVAHDLNDVLVPIWNTVRDMRQAPLESKYEPFLNDLEAQARRGMGLVRQILTFAGREPHARPAAAEMLAEGARPSATALAEAPRIPSGQRPAELPMGPELPMGQGECVLVIGDDMSISGILGETLEACGYQVLAARTGDEAVELYRARHGEIDVVVIDTKMSILDGESMMRQLLATDPGVVVIAVSGDTAEEMARSFENVRVYLEKPYTARKLLTSLKSVLA